MDPNPHKNKSELNLQSSSGRSTPAAIRARFRWFVWALLLLALVAAGVAWQMMKIEAAVDYRTEAELAAAPITLVNPPARTIQGDGTAGPVAGFPADADLAALRAAFAKRYGHRIDHPGVQMQAVEAVLRLARKLDPVNFEELARSMLSALFPEHVAQMTLRLEQYLAYTDWFESARPELATMTAEARQELIWAQRMAHFGEEAAASIWRSEIQSTQLRERMELIATQSAPVEKRAEALVSALDEIHGAAASEFLERHRQSITDSFLNQPGVQSTLVALSSVEREQALRAVRTQLGMDEQALERWTDLDRSRDERWSRGEAYMAERERLKVVATAEGATEAEARAAYERSLATLRESWFGAEAEIIAAEEASGYYRYQDARIYGRN